MLAKKKILYLPVIWSSTVYKLVISHQSEALNLTDTIPTLTNIKKSFTDIWFVFDKNMIWKKVLIMISATSRFA